MTTIAIFPEEVLIMIFEYLDASDLKETQQVCHAWYFPAHIQLLKEEIQLRSTLDIQRFIASIDYNPNINYLKAIKTIIIENYKDDATVHFDKEKLFFRFPNLESVFVYNYSILFQDFNDLICQEFIEHCPKLSRFDVLPDVRNPDEFNELPYQLRLLLTTIDVNDIKTKDKRLIDCIADFPRLQELSDDKEHLGTFQALLPMIDRLQHVKSIHIPTIADDQNGFAETYLASKSKDQQDLIIQRLSKVEVLEWKYQGDLCTNSAKFINKYLTGLNDLEITSTFEQEWTDPLERQTFYDYILQPLCSARHHGSLVLDEIGAFTLGLCLPDILKNVFKQAPSNNNRILRINLDGILDERSDLLSLEIKLPPPSFARMITIANPYPGVITNMLTRMMEKGGHLDDVDEFVFEMPQDTRIANKEYYEILGTMSFLKKVRLEIPKILEKELKDNHPLVNELMTVKELTIKAHNCYTDFQPYCINFAKDFQT